MFFCDLVVSSLSFNMFFVAFLHVLPLCGQALHSCRVWDKLQRSCAELPAQSVDTCCRSEGLCEKASGRPSSPSGCEARVCRMRRDREHEHQGRQRASRSNRARWQQPRLGQSLLEPECGREVLRSLSPDRGSRLWRPGRWLLPRRRLSRSAFLGLPRGLKLHPFAEVAASQCRKRSVPPQNPNRELLNGQVVWDLFSPAVTAFSPWSRLVAAHCRPGKGLLSFAATFAPVCVHCQKTLRPVRHIGEVDGLYCELCNARGTGPEGSAALLLCNGGARWKGPDGSDRPCAYAICARGVVSPDERAQKAAALWGHLQRHYHISLVIGPTRSVW